MDCPESMNLTLKTFIKQKKNRILLTKTISYCKGLKGIRIQGKKRREGKEKKVIQLCIKEC